MRSLLDQIDTPCSPRLRAAALMRINDRTGSFWLRVRWLGVGHALATVDPAPWGRVNAELIELP